MHTSTSGPAWRFRQLMVRWPISPQRAAANRSGAAGGTHKLKLQEGPGKVSAKGWMSAFQVKCCVEYVTRSFELLWTAVPTPGSMSEHHYLGTQGLLTGRYKKPRGLARGDPRGLDIL